MGCGVSMSNVKNKKSYTVQKVLDQDLWKSNFPNVVEPVSKMPHQDSLWVFMMAGQSNMAGRGLVAPQDTISNKRILTIDKDMNWIYAKAPIHFYEPNLKGLDCGMAFAKTLIDAIPDGISIAIIPCAVGGSAIEQWLNNETFRGVALLDNFKSKVAFSKEYGEIKGILWHQGESNAKEELIPSYSEKLSLLLNDFRNSCDNEALPIVLGELGSFAASSETQERWDAINFIINTTANKDKNMSVVVTKDLVHKGDKIHFDAESQRILGQRFAIKFLELKSK